MILRRMALVYNRTCSFESFSSYPDLSNQRIKESRSRSRTLHEHSPGPTTRPSEYRSTNHNFLKKNYFLVSETMDTAGLVSTVGMDKSM